MDMLPERALFSLAKGSDDDDSETRRPVPRRTVREIGNIVTTLAVISSQTKTATAWLESSERGSGIRVSMGVRSGVILKRSVDAYLKIETF